MAPKLGGILGYDNEMAITGLDASVASRTLVPLARRVWLYERYYLYPERAAHATKASVTAIVTTTRTRSNTLRSCCRKGLKPTAAW